MAQQGTYSLGSRTLANTDTVTGVVTGATADVPLSKIVSFTTAQISGLTIAQGGTGASTAAGARTALGAAVSGANTDITSLSGKAVSGLALNGANSDITSLTTVSSLSSTVTGTMQLVAGIGTTQIPALTMDALGRIAMPKNVVAFDAYATAAQTVTANVTTKLAYAGKTFDTTSAYDNVTNFRFQPTVGGYYQVNAVAQALGSVLNANLILYKNGSAWMYGGNISGVTDTNPIFNVGGLVYLNGSTDYLELWGTTSGTQWQANHSTACFQAILIAKA